MLAIPPQYLLQHAAAPIPRWLGIVLIALVVIFASAVVVGVYVGVSRHHSQLVVSAASAIAESALPSA
jgi:hypothetical protein